MDETLTPGQVPGADPATSPDAGLDESIGDAPEAEAEHPDDALGHALAETVVAPARALLTTDAPARVAPGARHPDAPEHLEPGTPAYDVWLVARAAGA